MKLNEAINLIKSKGYKITPQRKIILHVLYQKKQSLLSAMTIYEACEAHQVKTNLTTVYRNMDLLLDLDIVHKVLAEDGTALYQLNSNDHHHHLICKSCGQTEVLDYCPLSILNELSRRKSFEITEHKLELYGYCKKCIPKKEATSPHDTI